MTAFFADLGLDMDMAISDGGEYCLNMSVSRGIRVRKMLRGDSIYTGPAWPTSART